MRLASFTTGDRRTYGVVLDDEMLANIGAVLRERHPTLRSLLTADDLKAAADAVAEAPRLRFDQIAWLPVIPDPGKILCVGHNYEAHRQETRRAPTGHPSIFTRFADTLVGHDSPILCPSQSTMLDYEGELAVIIGKPGRAIAPADAWAHVAGLSCFNDASVRDWQWHTTQFAPGKNFPATGGFGPWMTTPDSVDQATLTICTLLNGEVMQSAPITDMIFDIPTVISYISTFTPLASGDVICTGTPGGVGAKREPPVWMKPGDRVEIDIAGLGCLRNPIGRA